MHYGKIERGDMNVSLLITASLTVNTSELGNSDITWSWGGSSGEHTSSDVGLSSQLLCLKLLPKTDFSLSQSIRYTKSWRFNPRYPILRDQHHPAQPYFISVPKGFILLDDQYFHKTDIVFVWEHKTWDT